jgi:hypothetical protein
LLVMHILFPLLCEPVTRISQAYEVRVEVS